MLSEQDKKDMLADARDQGRRKAFADARARSIKPIPWDEYLKFCQQVQTFFGFEAKPHKTEGSHFKL